MKGIFSTVTPPVLVCAAFPALFVLAPDGIPNTYAGTCTTSLSTIHNGNVNICRTCTNLYADPFERITVSSCSVTLVPNYCSITASVTYSIEISGSGSGCDTEWLKYCGGYCTTVAADTGPVTNVTRTTRVDCAYLGAGEKAVIQLRGKANCACVADVQQGSKVVFDGSGDSCQS